MNGWETAVGWYNEEQIYNSIQRSLLPSADPSDKFPTDVSSRKFAAWMTHQYRLAMAKGFQLAEPSKQKAIELLKQAYAAGHRDGWEAGETNAEVFAAVNDYLASELGTDWTVGLTEGTSK